MDRAGAADDRLFVDARFRCERAPTGVHNWARQVLAELPRQGLAPVEVSPARGHGIPGHAWEQVVLPARYALERSNLPLFSPCNWGPVIVRRQALVLFDVAPLVIPQYFSRPYAALAAVQLPLLARRVSLILTLSESARRDIVRELNVTADKVVVVGSGSRPLPEPDAPTATKLPASYFAFVGAHDARKNLDFLLELWPEVHQRTGAHLVVTRRRAVRTNVGSGRRQERWLHELIDPDDGQIAAVLQGSHALLWPSVYEGFGLPLLEAHGRGTPFISTASGAAEEVALTDDVVLPLDRDAWLEAVANRARAVDGDAARAVRRAAAAAFGWPSVAEKVAEALRSA